MSTPASQETSTLSISISSVFPFVPMKLSLHHVGPRCLPLWKRVRVLCGARVERLRLKGRPCLFNYCVHGRLIEGLMAQKHAQPKRRVEQVNGDLDIEVGAKLTACNAGSQSSGAPAAPFGDEPGAEFFGEHGVALRFGDEFTDH
jgi:hypothetical protein